MSRIVAVGLALVLVGCAGQEMPQVASDMKVLTFNIAGRNADIQRYQKDREDCARAVSEIMALPPLQSQQLVAGCLIGKGHAPRST